MILCAKANLGSQFDLAQTKVALILQTIPNDYLLIASLRVHSWSITLDHLAKI